MSTDAPTTGPVVAADGKANDDTEALRGELTVFVGEALPAWQRQAVPAGSSVVSLAEFLADWLIGFGYRRVVVDDDTVERAAAAIADADGTIWEDIQSGLRHGSKWAPKAADYYRSLARAAVRALRGATDG